MIINNVEVKGIEHSCQMYEDNKAITPMTIVLDIDNYEVSCLTFIEYNELCLNKTYNGSYRYVDLLYILCKKYIGITDNEITKDLIIDAITDVLKICKSDS